MTAPLGPEDVQRVWLCMKSALSHNEEERKQAEAVLRSLEERENYCSCLVEVLGHKDVDDSAQWLAAVQLKNIVSRHWASRHARDATAKTLTDSEKAHLRGKFMNLVALRNNKLAVQIAVVFAKVARHDFPDAWPTLFDDLLGKLSNPDARLINRTYLVLHHIFKELASKRLLADQKRFEDISQRLIDFIWSEWTTGIQNIVQLLPAGLASINSREASQLELLLEKWMLVTKILRRLLANGFGRDARTLEPSQRLWQCLPTFATVMHTLMQHRPLAPSPAHKCHAMLDVALLKLCKMIIALLDVHPWAFEGSGALQSCLQLCTEVVLAPRPGGLQWPYVVGRCMRFVTLVVQSPSYTARMQSITLHAKQGVSHDEMVEALKAKSAEVTAKLEAFWHEGLRRQRVVQSLLEGHLLLTNSDLNEWRDDPEAWYHANEGTSSEEEPRGIAEILFLVLLKQDLDAMAPKVVEAIRHARGLLPLSWMAAASLDEATTRLLLRKEAIYNAACCAAYELFDHVDFQEWLQNSLLEEIRSSSPHARVLQRRDMRLIAEWVASIKPPTRPAVYGALVELLVREQQAESPDACVQLVAVDTLRVMVEDWDFKEDAFVPFLHVLLSTLPQLLSSCSSFESHTLVFTLVSSIVERMGDLVRPHATNILSWLPAVWKDSEGQGLLRMQVLALMQRLVNALGPSSPLTYPLALPVLQYSLDPAGPEALNLLEDALLLWLVILRNAPDNVTDPLAFWPHWRSIMTLSVEHVSICMHIGSSLVLLGGPGFLQAHGGALAEVIAATLGDVKQEGMIATYGPMLLMLQLFGDEAVRLLQQPLLKLLHLLLSGEEERQSYAKGVTVFARAILHSPQAVLQLFDVGAKQGVRAVAPGLTPETSPPAADGAALFLAFLSDWLDSFDAIAQPADRKLCALALGTVLRLQVPGLLGCLDLIVTAITSVWLESEGGKDDERVSYGYDIYTGMGDGDDVAAIISAAALSEDAEGETIRRRKVSESDPVRTFKVSDWMKERMREAEAVYGPQLATALASGDPSITAQLQAMLV